MWAEHDVEVRRAVAKRIDHPLLGPVEVDCQVLHIPDTDQRLVIYTAPWALGYTRPSARCRPPARPQGRASNRRA